MQTILGLLPSSTQGWIQRDPPRAIASGVLWGVAAFAFISKAPLLLSLPLALLPLVASLLARWFPQSFEHYRLLRWLLPVAIAVTYTLLFFPAFLLVLLVLGYAVGYSGSFFWLVSQRGGGIGALLAAVFLFPMPIGHALLFARSTSTGTVRRGTQLSTAQQLQRDLAQQQKQNTDPLFPQLAIGEIEIPNELESYGFFWVGGTGSGKSQGIKRLLSQIKQRPDFRVVVFDRNAELLELFYEEGRDLICNPSDLRSVQWQHTNEPIEARTLATGLIPGGSESDTKERFFSEAARAVMATLFQRCSTNAELWEVLSTFSGADLADFCQGTLAMRYLGDRNSSGDIIATIANEVAFYERIANTGDAAFSFYNWALNGDPRSLYFPLFERDSELFKSYYSLGFDLILRGLLSNENRKIRTAIVIDELGALQRLSPLSRVLAEGRKFKSTAIIGTQSIAQIIRTYGQQDFEIISENIWTKMLLNCEGATAEWAAKVVGQQERVDIIKNTSRSIGSSSITAGTTSISIPSLSGSRGSSESIRETFAVMPSEFENLQPLNGYLNIKTYHPAKVKMQYQEYSKWAERHVATPPVSNIIQPSISEFRKQQSVNSNSGDSRGQSQSY